MKRGDQESQSTAGADLGEGHEKLQKGFAHICRTTREDERNCTPLMSERGHLTKTDMKKVEILKNFLVTVFTSKCFSHGT